MARTCLIYGSSVTRKTTQAKEWTKYIYERTGKTSLYMTGDGGAWEMLLPEIKAGLLRPLRISSTVVPLPVMRKISQGFWPEDAEEILDPSKLPNVVPIDWTKVGGMFIEGLSAMGQMVMRYMADQGVVIGEEPIGKFSLPISVEGAETRELFSGNSRAHYNFVQNMLYGLVMNFASLPCDMVVMTALEAKGEEGEEKSTILGPDIPGKKGIARVPAWFWNVIHHQEYKANDHLELRAHFMNHPDPDTGIIFKAKSSLGPQGVSKLQGTLAQGYYSLDKFSVADYLRLVDELNPVGVDELVEWRRKMDEKLERK